MSYMCLPRKGKRFRLFDSNKAAAVAVKDRCFDKMETVKEIYVARSSTGS